MKNFIISSAILLLIIAYLIFNSVMLGSFSEKLIAMTAEFSEGTEISPEAVENIYIYWKKIEDTVSVSVVHAECEAVGKALSQMLEYAKTGNFSEFHAAAALFTEACEHIAFSGKFSLETII